VQPNDLCCPDSVYRDRSCVTVYAYTVKLVL